MPRGAVVRGVGDVGLEDAAAHARGGCEVRGFDVLVIGADIADMGEGEGDDLAGIGGIGEDFLIAGDGGVEADFSDGIARGADAMPLENGAVFQHQNGRRFAALRHAQAPA